MSYESGFGVKSPCLINQQPEVITCQGGGECTRKSNESNEVVSISKYPPADVSQNKGEKKDES